MEASHREFKTYTVEQAREIAGHRIELARVTDYETEGYEYYVVEVDCMVVMHGSKRGCETNYKWWVRKMNQIEKIRSRETEERGVKGGLARNECEYMLEAYT